MSDLDIIRQIEDKIKVPLVKMTREELTKDTHAYLRAYCTDEKDNVTGLFIYSMGFADGELLSRLKQLETLILRYNNFENLEFLTKLPKLQSLFFRDSKQTDFSILSEIKGLKHLDLSGQKEVYNYYFLEELTKLRSLDLRSNNLSDVSFLRNLTDLTSLKLNSNKLSDVSFLHNHTSLRSLNLGSNNLSDVSFLQDLKDLKSLDLSWNKSISDYNSLLYLKGLTSLKLYRNNLSDVSFLRELTGLTSLNLGFTGQSDISFLRNHNRLTSLNLSSDNLSDVSILRELTDLTSLLLNNNELSDVSFLKDLPKLKTLNLSNNNLCDFTFLRDSIGLTSLRLVGNNLCDLSFLRDLTNLTLLDLRSNNLSDISFLRDFTSLTSLNLMSNNISDVSSLSSLTGLTSLLLGRNNLSDVSPLCTLTSLTSLYLMQNNFSDVSPLRDLKSLTQLSLGRNELLDMPPLYALLGLTSLDLFENNLSDVGFLRDLQGLTFLDLHVNNLSDISFVIDLPGLKYLNIDSNTNLKEPPEDIRNGGVEAIRNYFLQLQRQGQDYLYEAKVLFVGEPGAGKTSLMKKLINPSYPVPGEDGMSELSTLGIDIEPYSFKYKNDDRLDFTSHFWDFGGQNVQYYLHQFFLTDRSLYVLVVDDRRDNPNIDYWFNIIKLLGKGSPVLLVRNIRDIDSSTGFDRLKYEKRYADDFKISFRELDLSQDQEELLRIRNDAEDMASNLKHIGDKLPGGWIKVRDEIKKLKSRNYVTTAEFKELCARNDIKDEADQMNLCGYFHAIGILLHYKNDSELADLVFLNPQWITTAVYTVLANKELDRNNGIFTQDWLFDLLGDNYHYEEKLKILLLIQKQEFDFCYETVNGNYLVPQVLNDVAPLQANKWSRKGKLNFRYRYKFLPIGIVTRIIVRLNQWVDKDGEGRDLVWKSGVFLKKDDCVALVKEDISKEGLQVVDVSISGDPNLRKDFLAYIRGTIDEIHQRSFKNIDIEKMIPCVCERCVASEDPFYFEFSRLLTFVNSGEKEISCEKEGSLTKVLISNLVGGIIERNSFYYDDLKFRAGTELAEKLSINDDLAGLLRKLAVSEGSVVNIESATIGIIGDNTGTIENKVTGKKGESIEKVKKRFWERFWGWIVGGVALLAGIAAILTWLDYTPFTKSPDSENPGYEKPVESTGLTNRTAINSTETAKDTTESEGDSTGQVGTLVDTH